MDTEITHASISNHMIEKTYTYRKQKKLHSSQLFIQSISTKKSRCIEMCTPTQFGAKQAYIVIPYIFSEYSYSDFNTNLNFLDKLD